MDGMHSYIVTGRRLDEDDDTVLKFWADDREHATEQFDNFMWQGADRDSPERAAVRAEHDGIDLIVESVLEANASAP
ncbi:MAG TPA: hypothetical protein VFQ88_07225 [Nevskiaceae bacterium]|nr:hypothetical protein [Nevskiaceae bacterium]